MPRQQAEPASFDYVQRSIHTRPHRFRHGTFIGVAYPHATTITHHRQNRVSLQFLSVQRRSRLDALEFIPSDNASDNASPVKARFLVQCGGAPLFEPLKGASSGSHARQETGLPRASASYQKVDLATVSCKYPTTMNTPEKRRTALLAGATGLVGKYSSSTYSRAIHTNASASSCAGPSESPTTNSMKSASILITSNPCRWPPWTSIHHTRNHHQSRWFSDRLLQSRPRLRHLYGKTRKTRRCHAYRARFEYWCRRLSGQFLLARKNGNRTGCTSARLRMRGNPPPRITRRRTPRKTYSRSFRHCRRKNCSRSIRRPIATIPPH